ncbi:MAG: hypothetical protein AAB902_01535, partial [Patescibacteria group bacterium]
RNPRIGLYRSQKGQSPKLPHNRGTYLCPGTFLFPFMGTLSTGILFVKIFLFQFSQQDSYRILLFYRYSNITPSLEH